MTCEVSFNGRRLKMTAREAVWLERKIGCSVLEAFCRIDEISVALMFLRAATRRGKFFPSMKKAAKLYDGFAEEGGNLYELAALLKKTLTLCGFLSSEERSVTRNADWKAGKEFMKIFQEIHNGKMQRGKSV